MHVRKHAIAMTTSAGGAFTGYTDIPVNGRVLQIKYTKTDFADGSTMTLTGEQTGLAVWAQTGLNASATFRPRGPICDQAGVASLYAAAGEPVEDYVYIATERLKIVVASGGATKTGLLEIWVG